MMNMKHYCCSSHGHCSRRSVILQECFPLCYCNSTVSYSIMVGPELLSLVVRSFELASCLGAAERLKHAQNAIYRLSAYQRDSQM